MTAPFQLICHHTYAGFNGLPVDLSDYATHGEAIDTIFVPDGVALGSGALSFPHLHSRVRIPVSKAWRPLGGIKIEVTARMIGTGHDQTLIAGHDSFRVLVDGQHLFASFGNQSSLTSGSSMQVLSSFADSPDHVPHPVPYDTWVNLSFVHDGLDTMQLFIDGQLAAQRGALSGIPPVGTLGVSIGSEPDGTRTFKGEIDEVKVWRITPYLVDSAFWSRPVSAEVADCWVRFVNSLARALNRQPDCARFILGTIDETIDRIHRAILAKGPETRDRLHLVARRYYKLWRAGQIDGQEMAHLFRDWSEWLRLVGISIDTDPGLQKLVNSDCLKKVLSDCGELDCDVQFASYINLIARSMDLQR